MSNSIRSRNRAATAFLVSLAVFVPALVIPRSSEDVVFRTFILIMSLGATLISAVWFLVRWDEARRLNRLRSGKGILARWTIDPARWEWFRHHSSEWDKREGVRPNNADFAQVPGSGGIEIVVTDDGILSGEDFQPLEKNVAITVRADWMEFHQVIPKPRGPALHIVLRLPLQPGKEHLAFEIQQAYQLAYSAASVGNRGKWYVLLLIFIGLPLVTALIWFIGSATGWME